LTPIFSGWGSYGPELVWTEISVIYGLFLSDHEILSAVETELVILSAIMCQGFRAPTIWHLRGLRRLGVSEEDVELVQKVVEAVAMWAGKSVEGWPRVTDVPDKILN
jgi:Carboxymuconolactone decarboxylase family